MLIIRKGHCFSIRNIQTKSIGRNFCSSKDKSENDGVQGNSGENKKANKSIEPSSSDTKEESAAERLNRLLASMKTEEDFTHVKSIGMAKPKDRKKKTVDIKVKENEIASDCNAKVIEAAKKVASLYGDANKKQIESELLAKLLNLGDRAEKRQQKDENDLSLSELITGMQIDRRQQSKPLSRSDIVRKSFGGRIPPHHKQNPFADDGGDSDYMKNESKSYIGSVNLFGGKPLNIFTDPKNLKESADILKTWQHLDNRNLELAITHPPRNNFEKMILWTEQGKLWEFPINNEQGLNEEANVDFTEHIFLDQHLEDWCPSRGPIRHYMELVCVGLSKNPYISAKDKKDHILWYRDYFNGKKEILKDLMDQHKMAIATSPEKGNIKFNDAIETS